MSYAEDLWHDLDRAGLKRRIVSSNTRSTPDGNRQREKFRELLERFMEASVNEARDPVKHSGETAALAAMLDAEFSSQMELVAVMLKALRSFVAAAEDGVIVAASGDYIESRGAHAMVFDARAAIAKATGELAEAERRSK